MTGICAFRCMAQALAHGPQAFYGRVDFICFSQEYISVYLWCTGRRKHGMNIIQRKVAVLPKRNERQLIEHIGCKTPPFACGADRLD